VSEAVVAPSRFTSSSRDQEEGDDVQRIPSSGKIMPEYFFTLCLPNKASKLLFPSRE
jgi:hypothetical protein